jgi:hypothetical protein
MQVTNAVRTAAYQAAHALPMHVGEREFIDAALEAAFAIAEKAGPQPSKDEVERVARGIDLDWYDETRDEYRTRIAREAIAAMNRAPQEPVNPQMREALKDLLLHAGIADADPEDVDEDDRTRERRARAAIAAAEAAPKDEWQPTHQHAEGGLYRFVKDGLMREHDTPRTTGGWVAAIFYENEARQMFATAPSRWLARFTPFPAPPYQQDTPK